MMYDRDYMRGQEERGPLGWLHPHGSVVKALIIANVVVFVLNALSGNRLTDTMMLHPWYVSRMQLWRLLTYQFAHGSLIHLLFNMYGVWLFGRGVEQLLGPRRFVQLYLFSGVVGALLWLLANWWSGGKVILAYGSGMPVQSHYGSLKELSRALAENDGLRIVKLLGGCVGASGSMFGVMMAAAMAFPNARISLLFPPVSLRMKTFIWVYALIEVISLGNVDNVAHLAHLGGLLGAFIYMRRLRRDMQFSLWDWLKTHFCRPVRRGPDLNFPPQDDGPTSEEVDRVLEKMSRDGFESLTASERRTLDLASQRLRRQ